MLRGFVMLDACPYIVGITNSAPSLTPDGQRAVTHHDAGVSQRLGDGIAVEIADEGPVTALFNTSRHQQAEGVIGVVALDQPILGHLTEAPANVMCENPRGQAGGLIYDISGTGIGYSFIVLDS